MTTISSSGRLLAFVVVAAIACGRASAEAPTDPRLAQKVTYEARHQTVQKILEELSEQTGIKLKAGISSTDWPVRSRRMNIFVKDATMASLMNSIAHVMKFRWSCNDAVDPPVYRLGADTKAVIAADAKLAQGKKKSEERWAKRRADWVEIIMRDGNMALQQIEATRETDPVFFRYARYGALKALRALFAESTEAKDAFLAGRNFRISNESLSENTRELLYGAGDEFAKFMQMGRDPKLPGLSGSKVMPEDKFDVAYCRLDVGSFTSNRRWGNMTQGSTGYFHICKGSWDPQIVSLGDKGADWIRAICDRENMIIDRQGDRDAATPILDAHTPRLRQDVKEEEESLYPSEPLNKRVDFLEIEKTIKLKVEVPKSELDGVRDTAGYIASLEKALAEATGLGVVSDSWVNIKGEKLPEENDSALGDLPDRFAQEFDYNLDKTASIMEFRHRKWWKNRLNQVPEEWTAGWSTNTAKSGMLSLEDLAAISNLTYEQAEESLKPDKVLGAAGLYSQIVSILDANLNLQWLRLYSTLSPQLRALLMRERGINGQMLTSAQWAQAQTIFDRIGSTRGDAVFHLQIIPDKKKTTCLFTELDRDTGEVDRKWTVILPKYEAPKEKSE